MKNQIKKVMTVLFLVIALLVPAKAANADEVVAFTKSITIGGTFSNTLYEGAGNAKYTFSIKRSGALTVQIGFKEGSGSSWGNHGGITLYDNDGYKIDSVGVGDNSDGTDSGVFTADILAGDYYLYVDTRANKKAPAKIVVTTSFVDSNETVVDKYVNPHDSQDNPISLPLGKQYTGHLAKNGATDVYKVKINKKAMLSIATTNRTNGLSMNIINTNNTVNATYGLDGKTKTEKVFCPRGTYYITISKSNNYGTYTIKLSTSPLAKTTLKKVKNVKGQKMSVKFGLKSTNDAAGYQIQYSKSRKFKKGKVNVYIENSDYQTSTYTIENLKKKKFYYVRIRTYMTDNRGEKYYSAWSSVKKVKIKK